MGSTTEETKPFAEQEQDEADASAMEDTQEKEVEKEVNVKDEKKAEDKRPASKAIDKKTMKMIADLQRCKKQMQETRRNTHRPSTRPFAPDIFNSLSPYYDTYIVKNILQDLQDPDQDVPRKGFGRRAMALGIVEPEISWGMDNMPGPIQPSRIPGTLFKPKNWTPNKSGKDGDMGSTRLPPLPMPSIPKFNQSSFQPNKMTFDELAQFRAEMKSMTNKMEERRSKQDYDRTVKDWQRMNLAELKDLPSHSRYHVKKAIYSYLGTSSGSSRALKPLTKGLAAHTPEPLVQ